MKEWGASFQDTVLKIVWTLPELLKYLPERGLSAVTFVFVSASGGGGLQIEIEKKGQHRVKKISTWAFAMAQKVK